MDKEFPGYDKVSRALAKGATSFWKSVFDELAKGKPDMLVRIAGDEAARGIGEGDIKEFFAVLGGASMNVDLIPRLSKGSKTVFDAGDVVMGTGVRPASGGDASLLGLEGSISIGVGIRF